MRKKTGTNNYGETTEKKMPNTVTDQCACVWEKVTEMKVLLKPFYFS